MQRSLANQQIIHILVLFQLMITGDSASKHTLGNIYVLKTIVG